MTAPRKSAAPVTEQPSIPETSRADLLPTLPGGLPGDLLAFGKPAVRPWWSVTYRPDYQTDGLVPAGRSHHKILSLKSYKFSQKHDFIY